MVLVPLPELIVCFSLHPILERLVKKDVRKLAKIYAGRAARSIGGEPVLYRVVAPVDTICMNHTPGATVYHAAWAFVERI